MILLIKREKIEMEIKEEQAIEYKRFLERNGYIVIKETEAMRRACEECEAKDGNGDCFGCDASICIYNM